MKHRSYGIAVALATILSPLFSTSLIGAVETQTGTTGATPIPPPPIINLSGPTDVNSLLRIEEELKFAGEAIALYTKLIAEQKLVVKPLQVAYDDIKCDYDAAVMEAAVLSAKRQGLINRGNIIQANFMNVEIALALARVVKLKEKLDAAELALTKARNLLAEYQNALIYWLDMQIRIRLAFLALLGSAG